MKNILKKLTKLIKRNSVKINKKPPIGTPTPTLTGKDADKLFEETEKPVVWTLKKVAEIERLKKLAKRFFRI